MSNLSYMTQRDSDEFYDDAMAPPYDAMAVAQGDEATFDLRQLLQIVWCRKMTIVATSFILTTLAVLGVMQATPLYVAQAQLVVEEQRERALEFGQVLQGGRFDYWTNQTQAAILMSRGLAEKVVDEMDLTNHPLFNPALAEPEEGLFDRLDLRGFVRGLIPQWIRDELRRARGQEAEVDEYTDEELAAFLREDVIEWFLAGVTVDASDQSRVLDVQYISEDPDFAAEAANALAEVYINETILRKFEANARATDWLNQQVAELRQRLEASQSALEEHRRNIGYLDIEGQASILAQQLAELNTDLVRARGARAESAARFQQIEKLLESEEGIESAATVLDSPLIVRLREQETDVIRQLAELRTQLRGQHPRLILKENELADLRQKIRREVEKITTSLGNELQIAEIREQNTSTEVDKIKRAIEKQNEDLVTLRALESEVQANNSIYQAILNRFKETDIQEEALQQADARLISPAVPPRYPSYPRKTLIVMVALMGSILAGIVLVFIIEHLDAGFRSLPQIEQATGVRSLGIVPKLQGFGLRHLKPQDAILEKPDSIFSEAVRTIRTALLVSSTEAPRTILVTSALPAEGKTSLALSMGRSAAKAGQRIIAIDCDMRRPSLHEELGIPNLTGLAEYLEGSVELEEIIEIDEFSGMHYITAGHHTPNPTDLLNSERMRQLIERLKHAYDLTVFDTPPVLAISDTLMISKYVDKTIFVVRWGSTRRESAVAGLRALMEARANLAGVVLSQVDVRKHSGYAYGTYRYGYGSYEKHYHS